jgi:hypothetical protein
VEQVVQAPSASLLAMEHRAYHLAAAKVPLPSRRAGKLIDTALRSCYFRARFKFLALVPGPTQEEAPLPGTTHGVCRKEDFYNQGRRKTSRAPLQF